MNSHEGSYVKIEPTYPHDLLIHLSRLLKGDAALLKDREKFLDAYADRYEIDFDEMALLEFAYDRGIIDDFFECVNEPDWRKRALVEKSINVIVDDLGEKKSIILIESLMFAFGFDISFEIERKWDVKESERSSFHEKSKLERKYNDLKEADGARKEREEKTNRRDKKIKEAPNRKKASEKSRAPDARQDKPPSGKKPVQQKKKARAGESLKNDGADPVPPIKDLQKKPVGEAKFYNLMSLKEKRALKKALNGNASSQCEMGDFYSEEGAAHRDCAEAAKWYGMSAKNGYERAFFELGRLYDQNPRDLPGGKEKAFEIYAAMAERGFPTAQFILGMKYRFGDGVDVDMNKAVAWIEKAARQRHIGAVSCLADIYYSSGDYENANKWYSVGAGLGDLYCKERIGGR